MKLLLERREVKFRKFEFSLGEPREKRSSTRKLMSIMFQEHIPDNDRMDSTFRLIMVTLAEF